MYRLLNKIGGRMSSHSHHFGGPKPIDQFDRPNRLSQPSQPTIQTALPSRRVSTNQSVPVPFRGDTSSPEHEGPNPVKDMAIYGHSIMGFGGGKTECQDSYSILHQLTPDTHFFAVYDGHGRKGKDVSVYVNNHIAEYLKKNADNVKNLVKKEHIGPFFKEIFQAVDQRLCSSPVDSMHSGTTSNCVLISNGTCYIANLGDSRSILCRQGPSGQNTVIDLSQDHKPSRVDEQRRILQMGGIVEPIMHEGNPVGPLRVWDKHRQSGLAMTRSLGDETGKKAGIISEPEIQKLDLQGGDRFIIVASDGLWDVMSSEEAASFVLGFEAASQPRSQAPMAIVNEAQKRWKSTQDAYCDDITVVIAYIDFNAEGEAMNMGAPMH